MNTQELISLYLDEHIKIAKSFPIKEVWTLISTIKDTYKSGGVVYTFGNGGGADIASHFASDLSIHPFVPEDKKSPINKLRLDVRCLNTSVGLLTRLGNDIGFDSIFIEQLKSCNLNEDDIVVAFSTSGNSINLLLALGYANNRGVTTALVGGRDGGKAKGLVDICVLIPGISQFPGQVGKNDNCFHIEDFQSSIAHMITGILREVVNG